MRALTGMITAILLQVASGAAAQNVTVVELYTSQGCSSCPPADKMLHDMAGRDDIIALALHVDYWDYIGWKDGFASPAFTERQKGYARAAGARSVYTPQMIIGGQDHVIGSRPSEVAAHLANHMQKAPAVEVETQRSGNRVVVTARPSERIGSEVIVHLVSYRPMSTVRIRRGENAGKTLNYANVVTDWVEAKSWSGRGEYSLTATVPSDEPTVILFQRPDHGEIIGAAKLR